jgi:hypothetical protein
MRSLRKSRRSAPAEPRSRSGQAAREKAVVAPGTVLRSDMQRGFTGRAGARPPVNPAGAAVLRTANSTLAKRALPAPLPVLVVTV